MRIHICGGTYGRFLNLCANHQIRLWNVCPAKSGYEASLYLKDFYGLKPLARKCRTRVRIKKKCGLPFFAYRHRKRKVFVLGLCFCGFFIFFLSGFIWRINVQGNLSLSRQTLMEYLQECDISYGTRKREIDCKALAAQLRGDFPNLTWVSVKLSGTELSVSVQENAQEGARGGEESEKKRGNTDAAAPGNSGADMTDSAHIIGSDLVADADGIITSMITREGMPLVSEGDEVKKGELLVRGSMEITDDAGTVVNYRYCDADADVFLRTTLSYSDSVPFAYDAMEYTGKKRYGFYVKLFGNYFGIDAGIRKLECADIVTDERQARLFDDFFLPVSAGILCAREYRNVALTYTPEEASALAEDRLQKFLSQNEEKGVQIFKNNVKIEISATSCLAKGTIEVIKKTGTRVRTEKQNLPQEGTDE